MANRNQELESFEDTYQPQSFHRNKRYGRKKRSWVSLIIQAIVFILTMITGYSMWKQPVFNIVFTNDAINYHEIKNLQNSITNIGNLNINLGNIDQLQQNIDRLVLIFNAFFVLCVISLILAVLTLIFNRTVLKVVNILILAIMLVITLFFSYIIQTLAQRISEALKQYFLNIPPDQTIVEADAIHNGLILIACSIGLLVISLFFRNRRARVK